MLSGAYGLLSQDLVPDSGLTLNLVWFGGPGPSPPPTGGTPPRGAPQGGPPGGPPGGSPRGVSKRSIFDPFRTPPKTPQKWPKLAIFRGFRGGPKKVKKRPYNTFFFGFLTPLGCQAGIQDPFLGVFFRRFAFDEIPGGSKIVIFGPPGDPPRRGGQKPPLRGAPLGGPPEGGFWPPPGGTCRAPVGSKQVP